MKANYMTRQQKTLEELLNPTNLTRLVSAILQINTPNVVSLVRHRWEQGESIRGGIIGTYAWEDYKQYKMSLNPKAGGYVDLMLTGSLVDNLTLERVSEGIFKIISTDEKYQKIARRYGEMEFGITEEQKQELYADITNVAVTEILKQLW